MALLISGMTLAGVRMRDPSGSAQEGGQSDWPRPPPQPWAAASSGVNTPSGLSACTYLVNSSWIVSKLMQTMRS